MHTHPYNSPMQNSEPPNLCVSLNHHRQNTNIPLMPILWSLQPLALLKLFFLNLSVP